MFGSFPQLSQTATIIDFLSHPTWDLVVIFALIAGGFFYGISAGKRRIAATILYTYVAFSVFSVLFTRQSFSNGGPLTRWLEQFSETEEFLIHIGAFLVIFLALALLLGSRRQRGFAPASSWWQIFLLSFLQVGLLIHILLRFLPPGKFEVLAPITKTVFANPEFTLWWFAVPLVVVILLRWFERD